MQSNTYIKDYLVINIFHYFPITIPDSLIGNWPIVKIFETEISNLNVLAGQFSGSDDAVGRSIYRGVLNLSK